MYILSWLLTSQTPLLLPPIPFLISPPIPFPISLYCFYYPHGQLPPILSLTYRLSSTLSELTFLSIFSNVSSWLAWFDIVAMVAWWSNIYTRSTYAFLLTVTMHMYIYAYPYRFQISDCQAWITFHGQFSASFVPDGVPVAELEGGVQQARQCWHPRRKRPHIIVQGTQKFVRGRDVWKMKNKSDTIIGESTLL